MLFELEDVTYRRGGRLALDGVSAKIPRGVTAILGPSGCGKSSLLRLLVRLSDPDAGTVRFEGRDVRELDVLELRRRAVWMPQLPVLEPGTVGDNLRLAAALSGRPEPDVGRLCGLAGLDQGDGDRDSTQLSVGQRQRAMFARALACEPEALLLDEPTASLDSASQEIVEHTIGDLHERSGVSIVLVTHISEQAERLAKTTIRMQEGRVL